VTFKLKLFHLWQTNFTPCEKSTVSPVRCFFLLSFIHYFNADMHRLQSADCSKCITLHLKFLHYFVCKNIRLIWYLSRDGTRYPAARPTSLLQMNRRVGTWQVGVRTRSQLWVTNGQTLSRCLIPAAVRVLSRYTQTRTQTDRQTDMQAHTPITTSRWFYYRAMNFSAQRGIAIACRLSVRLSVCDVGEL